MQKIECKMYPSVSIEKMEDNEPSEENEMILEKMLMEAERLAIQIRTAAGTGSNSIEKEDIPRSARQCIPDSIETCDNQTECSSIGLGHGVENSKWSSSVFCSGGIQEYGPRLTIPEETSAEDASATIEPTLTINDDSTLRSQTIRRSIEELVQKSKESVHLDTLIRRVVSSTSGGSEQDKIPNPSTGSISNDTRTVERSDSCEETIYGSVATKYHDVQSVAKYEAIPEENQYDLSMLKQILRSNQQVPFLSLDENGEDSEKEATSVSSNSQSNNNYEKTAAISSISPQGSPNRHEKSMKNRMYIANTPVLESQWMNNNVITRQDDDYVSIADYCQPKVPKDMKSVVVDKNIISNNSVRWENMTSAKVGDNDFTSVQDYSNTQIETCSPSEFRENNHETVSALRKYRALTAKRANSKRKKHVIRFVLFLLMVLFIQLNWMTILHIHSSVMSIINPVISKVSSSKDLSLMLEKVVHASFNTINWVPKDITVVEEPTNALSSDTAANDFYIMIHQNMCASECCDYFDNDASADLMYTSIPFDCYGSSYLHVESPTIHQHSKKPNICSLPIISGLVPACRRLDK